jgi:D-alanyl-D-alanine dipeptidase
LVKPLYRVIFAVTWVCGVLLAANGAKSGSPLGSSRQVIAVTTPSWSATTGTLQRFERVGEQWRRVGSPIPVVVGRSGLGWGAGLQTQAQMAGSPTKQEGDGRSPAGVFSIGAAFGYDADKPAWMKLPYVPLTSATECVDDSDSSYYNSVVDRVPTQSAGWKSSEKMRQIAQYRWGVIVNQNVDRTPGAGSCIFLHIWNGPADPTAGCTAMQQSDLEEIIRWVDPSASPLFVALPVSEYERLRRSWQLPPL